MRLLEILLFLMKNNKTTMDELSKKFNVSKRTIQRDLDKLSVLGIPIISKRGNDGGIILDRHYLLSNIVLTVPEYKSIITSLYIGENIVENIKSISILKKLFLVDRYRLEKLHDEVTEYFVVDLIEKKINMLEGSNKSINYALETKSIIRVHLEEKSYTIKPISYVLKSDGLYLYAHYINKYILIKIDDINTIDILEENYNRNFIQYKYNNDINFIKK